jgi:hypothetical protein
MSFAVLFIWSFHFFPQHGINRMSPMTYAVCAISANKLLKELCFWMVNVHAESWMTWQTTDSSFFSVAYAFIGYCLVVIFSNRITSILLLLWTIKVREWWMHDTLKLWQAWENMVFPGPNLLKLFALYNLTVKTATNLANMLSFSGLTFYGVHIHLHAS